MTAIAAVYTRYGFVIAADGKLGCEDPDASDTARRAARDDAQKIFDISGDGRSVACAFMGTVLTTTVNYDLSNECMQQVSKLSRLPFGSGCSYVYQLSHELGGYIDTFRNRYPGSVGDKPITMLVVGYFKGEPCPFKVIFPGRSLPLICPCERLRDGAWDALGSDIVKNAMYVEHDPSFSAYAKVPTEGMSLEDAEGFAKGYIEACKTPLARQLDPFCEHIGGNVHVAQVTRLGFSWAIPPRSRLQDPGGPI